MANEQQLLSDEELIKQEYWYLIEDYKSSVHNLNYELIDKAYNFATNAHHGARRRSGEPYMIHPLSVARIVVKEIGLGTTSICASLLHDVVEDTDYTVDDIRNIFGDRIANIVDGLTKISGGVFAEQASTQAENFRKLLLTISEDIRVIMIKIADRLHNMRTLSSMPPAKQYKIAGETTYIYAPLAYRLGLYKIKIELEDLSLKYEHPEIYQQIKNKLLEGDTQRQEVFSRFIKPIENQLQLMNYEYDIEMRIKSISSIWNKMKTKNIPFEDVYDLLAVRIIFRTRYDIEEKNQAWMVYSAVTSHYRPHPERIRDWISTPKANGYEALHVTVMGPEGIWIEVQIRSERMHAIAERGISAHWKYKSGEQTADSELDNWLKTIKEMFENPEPSAIDFLDTFKLNLFATEIFVFTPKGEIKTLPQGATALDFAFYLHSDLGYQCIGAKVNHKLEALSHVLNSGDQVEILTSKKQTPQIEWLNFVTTARAQSKLKAVFKKETRSISALGKQLLEESLHKLGIRTDNNESIDLLLEYFKLGTKDDLYYELGRGTISLEGIDDKVFKKKTGLKWRNYWKFQFVGARKNNTKNDDEELTDPDKPIKKIDRSKTLKLTDDNKDEAYEVAECCNPIPGDDVLGYVNDNELITIHKRECAVAAKLKSNFGDRIVSIDWSSKKILSFPAVIEVKGIDTQGVLIQIIQIISEEFAVNIDKLKVESHDGIFEGIFQLNVHAVDHINQICAKILKLKAINSVKRVDLSVTES